ncbi:unnamed protein product [Phytophthora fragariaefolia]|uniref:Unnamed protein product n=1 Tax=Phytophthora fragariaefolia TaxID=1490495 RepID=A0A9W7CXV8_9STRA|nr:unnamed protein product [Phytophthora fragariaefolia]
MAGVGTVPSDEELEAVTLQAFRDLNKGSTQSITKTEFTKWIIEFASGAGAPPAREVTLQQTLEQFRVIPCEEKNENNSSDFVQNDNKYYDGSAHIDDPQHETEVLNENAVQFTVDEEHNANEGAAESIEPEHVAKIDEQYLSDRNIGHEGSNPLEIEAQDDALVGEGDQEEAGIEYSQSDHQAGETQDYFDAEHPTNYCYEAGVDHLDPTIDDTESDYPTFVADGDESAQMEPQEKARDQNASNHEQNFDLHADVKDSGIGGLDAPQDNSNYRGSETMESVAMPEELCADEYQNEVDNDNLLYEEDEFAHETPRTEREVEALIDASPGDDLEYGQPVEDPEPSPVPEEQDTYSTQGETQETVGEEAIHHDVDTPTPANVSELHVEPAEPTFTPGNAEAREEVVQEPSEVAAVDLALTEEVPATDVNTFDTEEVPATDANAFDTEEVPATVTNTFDTEEVPAADVNTFDTEEVPATDANAFDTEEVPVTDTNTFDTDEVPATDYNVFNTGKMPATDANAFDTKEVPALEVNAFDTYDFEQPQFDGSSGLPPPEPHELIDDATAAATVGDAPE